MKPMKIDKSVKYKHFIFKLYLVIYKMPYLTIKHYFTTPIILSVNIYATFEVINLFKTWSYYIPEESVFNVILNTKTFTRYF